MTEEVRDTYNIWYSTIIRWKGGKRYSTQLLKWIFFKIRLLAGDTDPVTTATESSATSEIPLDNAEVLKLSENLLGAEDRLTPPTNSDPPATMEPKGRIGQL